jgi:hypothetical protein
MTRPGEIRRFAWIFALALAGGCYVPVNGNGGGNGNGNGGVGSGSDPDASVDGGAGDLLPEPDLGGWVQPVWHDPTGNLDLTMDGTLDWAHWGLYGENSVERRAGVTPLITAIPIGTGPLHQYTDNHVVFSWSNGQPAGAVNATPTGVFIVGQGNGFQVQVPAESTPHRLKVYLSAFGADYQLTGHISDGSFVDYVDQQYYQLADNGLYRVYTFTYKSATPGTIFTVSWIDTHDHFGGANVTLQAATLE